MAGPRFTFSLREDGAFELYLNEAGRDLLVKELIALDRENDHLHLDYFACPQDGPTDIFLSNIPYQAADRCLEHGKILLRPDDWDREYFLHVFSSTDTA